MYLNVADVNGICSFKVKALVHCDTGRISYYNLMGSYSWRLPIKRVACHTSPLPRPTPGRGTWMLQSSILTLCPHNGTDYGRRRKGHAVLRQGDAE